MQYSIYFKSYCFDESKTDKINLFMSNNNVLVISPPQFSNFTSTSCTALTFLFVFHLNISSKICKPNSNYVICNWIWCHIGTRSLYRGDCYNAQTQHTNSSPFSKMEKVFRQFILLRHQQQHYRWLHRLVFITQAHRFECEIVSRGSLTPRSLFWLCERGP